MSADGYRYRLTVVRAPGLKQGDDLLGFRGEFDRPVPLSNYYVRNARVNEGRRPEELAIGSMCAAECDGKSYLIQRTD